MGTIRAMGMAEAVGDGSISLERALEYHLTVNHFPPVPSEMVPVAMKAIQLANDGNWGFDVDLPEGVSWKGRDTAPVTAIVQSYHLDAFLEEEGL